MSLLQIHFLTLNSNFTLAESEHSLNYDDGKGLFNHHQLACPIYATYQYLWLLMLNKANDQMNKRELHMEPEHNITPFPHEKCICGTQHYNSTHLLLLSTVPTGPTFECLSFTVWNDSCSESDTLRLFSPLAASVHFLLAQWQSDFRRWAYTPY